MSKAITNYSRVNSSLRSVALGNGSTIDGDEIPDGYGGNGNQTVLFCLEEGPTGTVITDVEIVEAVYLPELEGCLF